MATVKGNGYIFNATSILTDATSDVLETRGALVVRTHFVSASGDRGGTLSPQVSQDGTNWVAVKFKDKNDDLQSSLTITASTAFNESAWVENTLRYLRWVFTDVDNGAGTLTALAESIARDEGM